MTTTTLPQQIVRSSDLETVLEILRSQQAVKVDVIGPASGIRLDAGRFIINDHEVVVHNEGVTDPNGAYAMTSVAEQQIATLLGIPVAYLRRMLTEKVSLADANVNAWAADQTGTVLFRLFQGYNPNDPIATGLLRAVLSNKFNLEFDNLDTVFAVVEGMTAAGLNMSHVTRVDLSNERLYLHVNVPEIAVAAKELVRNYRSPFNGLSGADLPLMNAGLVFTNSEVGRGAFQILPEAVLQVCSNGLTRAVDGFRRVHLGGRLQEGTIAWSSETVEASNTLIKAQVKDAVASFLSEGYLESLRDDLLRDAGVEITDVTKTIEVVSKKLQYSQSEQNSILADFIKGGQVTSGGILNAVTSVSQKIEEPDRAHEFNLTAIDAMKIAARYATAGV